MKVLNVIKGVFSSGKGLDPQEIFNTVAKGIDKLSFSTQERANFNLSMCDKMASFAESSLSENSIRSKTRRFMAKLIVGEVILIINTCIILIILGYTDKVKYIIEICNAFQLGWAFITVIGFHFGTYLLMKFSEKKKKG